MGSVGNRCGTCGKVVAAQEGVQTMTGKTGEYNKLFWISVSFVWGVGFLIGLGIGALIWG